MMDAEQAKIMTDQFHHFSHRKATKCRQPFAFRRMSALGDLLCLFNFTDRWLAVPRYLAMANGARTFWDHLSEAVVETRDDMVALPPSARVWLG